MPAYVADLHNHTPHLSGSYACPGDTKADDVIRAAAQQGIDILGATDHFCADYAGQLARAARRYAEETGHRMLILGGAELKLMVDQDEVHVVALFEADVAEQRLEEVLAEFGVTCSMADRDELSHLVARADPIEVARGVREAGGIAVAAHVDRAFGEYRLTDSSFLMEIIYSQCFDAIEVTEQSTYEWFQQMSTPAVIASSNSHSLGEIGTRTTLIAMEGLTFAELRRALRRASAVPRMQSPG
jgi:PHP family Zn ribbon phosphoesterase